MLEKKKVSTVQGQDSGHNSTDSFATYDRATSSWKTSQGCLFEGWIEYSETWPQRGMMRNGRCYPQPMSERPISASGSGLLPTPAAVSYGTNQGGAAGRTGKVRPSLETMAKKDLWPTPKAEYGGLRTPDGKRGADLQDKVINPEMWPTPSAGDANIAAPNQHTSTIGRHIRRTEGSGKLNPMWVEWLMGYPSEWTVLEDLETP